MKELQKDVDALVSSMGGYWEPLAMLAAVVEELGEVARELNAFVGAKPKKEREPRDRLSDELGDLAFAVLCLFNFFGLDLDAAVRQAMKKYVNRDDAKRFAASNGGK